MSNERIIFTEAERNSATYMKLVEFFERRLQMLREKNDGYLSEFETATLRGQIAEVKSFLNSQKPPVNMELGDQGIQY